MNKIPYRDFKTVISKKELVEYQNNVKDSLDNGEYIVYGTPAYKDEAPVVVFDNKGVKMKLKNKYFITCYGEIRRYNKNGELNKKSLTQNKNGTTKIMTEENGKLSLRRHVLLLWSFYPHLDWSVSLQADQDSTVDHIMGTHEGQHFALLEVIPRGENTRRSSLHTDIRGNKNAITRSKPFNVYKNGELIFKCENMSDASTKFLQYENIITRTAFTPYLKNNKSWRKIYIFCYVDEKEPDILEDEIWRTEDQWCQKDELLKLWRPPKTISSKGRIKTQYDKITRGHNHKRHKKSREYSNLNVAKLVHLAFSEVKIKEKELILHLDGSEPHPDVMLNDGSGRYSNALGTFRVGTYAENARDMSELFQRKAEAKPENEFIVKKDGVEIGRYFYIPHCERELSKIYEAKSYGSGIHCCLNGNSKTFYGFTCEWVIPRVELKND
tara:strand:- start:80 stop:1399 length:1320 start_codon:yes stop_codon:yes gene_type:complete